MNKRRLKRILCNLTTHKYLFEYSSYSFKYKKEYNVYRCKRCKKKIKKLKLN